MSRESYMRPDITIWVINGDYVEVIRVQHPGHLSITSVSGHHLKEPIIRIAFQSILYRISCFIQVMEQSQEAVKVTIYIIISIMNLIYW